MKDACDYSVVAPDHRDALKRLSIRLRYLIKSETPIALQIGKRLLEVKRLLPHGHFALFCKSSLQLDPRLAQLYMRVAGLADSIGHDTVQKLPLSVAHQLAAKKYARHYYL